MTEILNANLEQNYPVMTVAELDILMKQLAKIYDVVRLVDAERMRVLVYDETGNISASEQSCHEIWGKCSRCENCVSGMAFRNKGRMSKFEFIEHDVYHVTSQYILVDGTPCNLEIVEKHADTMLYGAFGKSRFVEQMNEYAEKIYTDSLTRVSNRKYFDEQLSGLEMDAVAMIDIDNFKMINDTYGHLCGDKVLHAVAQSLQNSIRSEDHIVRYGGDEFVLAFSVMKKDCFYERLEEMRKMIEQVVVHMDESVNASISIGGAYGRCLITDLLSDADQALYEAKKKKNHVTVKERDER